MKRFFLFSLLIIWSLLTACSAQTVVEEPTRPASSLQVVLVSADYAVGRPRVSFALFDGTEAADDVQDVTIRAVKLDEDLSATDAPVAWAGQATNYNDYEIPYWVFFPELDQPGYWGMVADLTAADGTQSQADFVVELRPESMSPAIGMEAPASHNRTLASEPDILKLSSGNDPDPALYQLTVAEAIGSGKPTVVGFLTPGFCQTKWCAPVLESVEAIHGEVGDAANFIHVEVYDDFQALTVVKEMAEWGLDTEPWVFVLDKDGRVAAKFSGPLSPRELKNALEPLLS
jgi:hypothetical protein